MPERDAVRDAERSRQVALGESRPERHGPSASDHEACAIHLALHFLVKPHPTSDTRNIRQIERRGLCEIQVREVGNGRRSTCRRISAPHTAVETQDGRCGAGAADCTALERRALSHFDCHCRAVLQLHRAQHGECSARKRHPGRTVHAVCHGPAATGKCRTDDIAARLDPSCRGRASRVARRRLERERARFDAPSRHVHARMRHMSLQGVVADGKRSRPQKAAVHGERWMRTVGGTLSAGTVVVAAQERVAVDGTALQHDLAGSLGSAVLYARRHPTHVQLAAREVNVRCVTSAARHADHEPTGSHRDVLERIRRRGTVWADAQHETPVHLRVAELERAFADEDEVAGADLHERGIADAHGMRREIVHDVEDRAPLHPGIKRQTTHVLARARVPQRAGADDEQFRRCRERKRRERLHAALRHDLAYGRRSFHDEKGASVRGDDVERGCHVCGKGRRKRRSGNHLREGSPVCRGDVKDRIDAAGGDTVHADLEVRAVGRREAEARNKRREAGGRDVKADGRSAEHECPHGLRPVRDQERTAGNREIRQGGQRAGAFTCEDTVLQARGPRVRLRGGKHVGGGGRLPSDDESAAGRDERPCHHRRAMCSGLEDESSRADCRRNGRVVRQQNLPSDAAPAYGRAVESAGDRAAQTLDLVDRERTAVRDIHRHAPGSVRDAGEREVAAARDRHVRDDVALVREGAREDERAGARHKDGVRRVLVAADASRLRRGSGERAVRHLNDRVSAAVVRHVEVVRDGHRAAVHLQARRGTLGKGRVAELVAPHGEAVAHRHAPARHAERGARQARGRVVRVAVVAAVHEPAGELHVAAGHLHRRVDLLNPFRGPAADSHVVRVTDAVGSAPLAKDERAFEDVEAAVAGRGRVAVRVRNESALEALGAVAQDARLVKARRTRAGEVERTGTGLHEGAACLHEVAGEREVAADVIDRGLVCDRRVVRKGTIRPAAVRTVVSERARADRDGTGRAEARRLARRRHAIRDKRAAPERGGGGVGAARINPHDAAAGRTGVDAHGGGGRDRSDIRLHASTGMDRHLACKNRTRQTATACRHAYQVLHAHFHVSAVSSHDVLYQKSPPPRQRRRPDLHAPIAPGRSASPQKAYRRTTSSRRRAGQPHPRRT